MSTRVRVGLVAFLIFYLPFISAAELPLIPNQSTSQTIGEYIFFNSSAPANASAQDLAQIEFLPINQTVANFGIGQGARWLRLELINTASSPSTWILGLNRTLLDQLQVLLVSEGSSQQIMQANDRLQSYSSFGTLAAPFNLTANQSASLYIFYEGPNSSVLPISIETSESIEQARLFKLYLFFGSFAGVFTLVVYNTILALITRMNAFLFYGAAQIVLFSYFTHLSGITTVYLWPESPEIGNILAPILAIATCLLNVLFIQSFVKQEYLAGWLNRSLKILVYVSSGYILLAILGFAFNISIPFLSSMATLVTTVTIVVLPVSGVLASRNRRYRYVPMTIAWFWFSISISYTTLTILNIMPVTPSFLESYMIFAFVEAILLSISLALTVRHIERSRAATQDSLALSLATELEESRRAERLMRERSMALDDLADRGRLLQAAGHDTRQALFAMRQFTSGLEANGDQNRINTAKQAINQLVNHVDDVLATTLAGAHGGAMIDQVLALEKVSLHDLLEPIRLIYQRSAIQKGLRLRIHHSDAEIVTDRVLLIRIVSNMVSNAIKYTHTGGLLVGCRSTADSIRIQVWDTGEGLDSTQLDSLLNKDSHSQRFNPPTDGLGSGFQISRTLAEKLNIKIAGTSVVGKGSMFECVIPHYSEIKSSKIKSFQIKNTGIDNSEIDNSEKDSARIHSAILHCYILDDDPMTVDWINQAGITIEDELPSESLAPVFIDYDFGGTGKGLARAKELGDSFPNLILTSYDHGADVRDAAAGVVKYLAYKPLCPETLQSIVSRIEED